MKVSMSKTVVVSPFCLDELADDVKHDWEERGVPIVSKAKMLGLCLSAREGDTIRFLEDKIGPESERFTRALALMADPRMEPMTCMLFATQAIQHWADYYARLVSPSAAADLFDRMDRAILTLILQKFGRSEIFDSENRSQWHAKFQFEIRQMQLPTHWGGVGLRPLRVVSKASYLASLAACATEIISVAERSQQNGEEIRFPSRYEKEYGFCRQFLIAAAPTLEHLVFENVNDDIDALQLVCLPTKLSDFLRTFQQHPILSNKFQKRLCVQVWMRQFQVLREDLAQADLPLEVARLESCTAQGAGRIWTLYPTSKDRRLNAAEAQQTLRLHLGALPAAWMYDVEGPLLCPGCRKVDMKKVPGHSGHCPSYRREYGTQRHDAVCIVLESSAKSNLVPTLWTPYLQGGKATDLAFSFWNQMVEVDVTIVAPDAPSKAKSKASERLEDPTFAAAAAAGAKIAKYSDLVEAEGAIFLPLAFQTTGGYTRQVNMLIKRIAQAGEDNAVTSPVSSEEIRARLAVVIARGNALINMNAASRIRAKSPAWAAARATRRRRARRMVQGAHRPITAPP
jgi:hypothetical protein